MTKEKRKLHWSENVVLGKLTTFKIGGPARYYFRAETEEDLIEALRQAREGDLPVFILGSGSNILVSDQGYPGAVIQLANRFFRFSGQEMEVGAGVALNWLATEAARLGIGGLECETAVPGTVGGAVYGNAGTPDHHIGQLVKKVYFIDRKSLEPGCYSANQCQFDYRQSVFKEDQDKVITSIVLAGQPEKREVIWERMHDLAIRKAASQPRFYPSAGCVFKNPPGYSAGALIDQAGLKGRRIGQAQISEQHANFIINLGRAKSRDVLALIDLIKEQVNKQFKIELVEEIIILSEPDKGS